MSGIGKILRHANKQRYTAHREENMSSMEAHQKLYWWLKTVTTTFHMFKNLEKHLNMSSRNKEDKEKKT